MICLMAQGRLPAWVVLVIIGREFIISGFRLVASDNGIVIAASYWGKIKTICQMMMIILLLADLGGGIAVVEESLIILSVVLTVISLADYLWKNKHVLSMQD
jgi:CDP-diacylglycerol--glycerol-3-phosphate 3-phosphatidyltransferase